MATTRGRNCYYHRPSWYNPFLGLFGEWWMYVWLSLRIYCFDHFKFMLPMLPMVYQAFWTSSGQVEWTSISIESINHPPLEDHDTGLTTFCQNPRCTMMSCQNLSATMTLCDGLSDWLWLADVHWLIWDVRWGISRHLGSEVLHLARLHFAASGKARWEPWMYLRTFKLSETPRLQSEWIWVQYLHLVLVDIIWVTKSVTLQLLATALRLFWGPNVCSRA